MIGVFKVNDELAGFERPLRGHAWSMPRCLRSSAFSAGAWAAVHLVADVPGGHRWPAGVRMAGENALGG